MLTVINDDFDLQKIYLSGQCFRMKVYEDGGYRLLSGEHFLYIRKTCENKFAVSCGEEEWNDIWAPYFDLSRNYSDIRKEEYGKSSFADEAMDFGKGIRVLKQDPWETLVTFIISQRKNIPAISRAVEALAAAYGHTLDTGYETVFSFPTPGELARSTEEELRGLSLGYRAPYVLDAVARVSQGQLDLDSLFSCDDDELLDKLQEVHGVGRKVANCVALFAYARMSCVPIDVWIARAIEEDCNGCSPFDLFGDNAGIIQQYIFFYERLRDKSTEVN